jgi:predicted PurR-regulated permease PerM
VAEPMLPQSARARWRLVLAIGVVLVVGWLLWVSWAALSPFLVGAILAFAFAPLVDRIAAILPFRATRPDLALSIAIGLVYIVAIGLLIGLGMWLGPLLAEQARSLTDSVPSLVERVQREFERNAGWYRQNVPEAVQRRIEAGTQDLAGRAANIGVELTLGLLTLFTGGVGQLVAYIVTPFWLFLVLRDRVRGVSFFVGLFPPTVRPDVRLLLAGADRTLGSFIRAQLLNALIAGVTTGLGLWWLGVPFSFALGVLAGFANLIPVLGAMIAGVPALIVAAALTDPLTVLWTFLFLFIAQNVRAYAIVPRIQGQAVNIHPAIILVLLVIGGKIAGFWGLLLVVPVTAVARDIFVHIYRRLGEPDEPATTSPPAANASVPTGIRRMEGIGARRRR